MLTRICLDDPGTVATLEASARAVTELAGLGLMAMVEPFLSVAARAAGCVNLLDPDVDDQVDPRSPPALGASSAHTWLKLPVVDELERVMDATTLPTLLLGGDPQGDPHDTYASWGARARPARRARPRRRARPALPAGRRRRRGRRHRRRARARGERDEQPLGAARSAAPAARAGRSSWTSTSTAGRYTGLYAGRCCPARSDGSRPATRELIVVPLSGSVDVQSRLDGDHVTSCSPAGRRCSPGRPTSPIVPRDSDLVLEATSAAGSRSPSRRPRPAPEPLPLPPRRRRGRARRAARRRPRLARGPQLRHPRRARRRLDHRLRGHHAGRQLELLPAAQARRGRARGRRDRARGDLLLRGPGRLPRRRGAPTRWPTSGSTAPTSVRSTCSPRCAPVTSSSCPTAGTARRWRPPATTSTTSTSWPGPGPERRLADLRRPGPRLGPRHLDGQDVDPRLPLEAP